MSNIYIAAHKKYQFPKGYQVIHVGKDRSTNIIPNAIGDNTGDNISSLNPFFCELTGLYWIWKNDQSEIIGLVHYRRHFKHKKDYEYINNVKVATKEELIDNLVSYDLVLPTPSYLFRQTLKEQYIKYHKESDVDATRMIIEKKYPEYIPSFDATFGGNKGYYCNMFVAKREVITPYFQWLFDILFELYEIIDIASYDSYQQRVFGFLSERLFSVWIEHNKESLNIYHRPVIEIESKKIVEIKRGIRSFLAKGIRK